MTRSRDTPFALVGQRPFKLVIDEQDFDAESPIAEVLERLAVADGVEAFSTSGERGQRFGFEVQKDRPDLLRVRAGDRDVIALEAHQWEDWATELVEEGVRDHASALRDLHLAIACRALGCDALVTQSGLLLKEVPRPIVRQTRPVTVRHACALLGLYLRVTGHTVPIHYGITTLLDRTSFYGFLTEDLMPALPRAKRCARDHGAEAGEDRLFLLVHAVGYRLGQALRARDDLLRQVLLGLAGEAREEAHHQLDVLLIMCSAVLDNTARVADAVYAVGYDRPAWTQKEFRKQMSERESGLVEALRVPGRLVDVVEVVAKLRNQIHEIALQSVSVSAGSARTEERFLVPTAHTQAMRARMERLGGLPRWDALEEAWEDGTVLMLGFSRFADKIVLEVAQVADALLAALHFDGMHGVSAGLADKPDRGLLNTGYRAEMGPALRAIAGLPQHAEPW